MSTILCLVFFVSGAAALLFETLWFRQAGLVLGNSVWASSLVLASFMAGLALGNTLAAWWGDRIRRPLLFYAQVEAAIAVFGVGLVWLLPELNAAMHPVLRLVAEQPWLLNGLRLLIAFGLLLLPATAMGLTLPLVVRILLTRDPHYGSVLGRLYGWNTLGAMVGALAGEMLLIEWLAVLADGEYMAGSHEMIFDAKASKSSTGIYMVELLIDGQVAKTDRLIRLK